MWPFKKRERWASGWRQDFSISAEAEAVMIGIAITRALKQDLRNRHIVGKHGSLEIEIKQYYGTFKRRIYLDVF